MNARLLVSALPGALRKLDPRVMWHNPVMFVVEVGAAFVTVAAFFGTSTRDNLVAGAIAIWLWLTVLFANLAESVAEGRGKAQAQSLRQSRSETVAHRLLDYQPGTPGSETEDIYSPQLDAGDFIVVQAGEQIPSDGDIVWGIATVDESAITGESAPVVREAGGDRSAVTGGTRVLSDRIVVQVTAKAGETFVDKMIALVEGASRTRTPNEIALSILLAALSIVFILVIIALAPLADAVGDPLPLPVLAALLVCLIPTTIGALLSAIGIAGMDRLVQRNVLARSGRAVEAAGDVQTLLLDKTGTITYGNRQAAGFYAVDGVTKAELIQAAAGCSQADPTPEGQSVVTLAESWLRDQGLVAALGAAVTETIPFAAETRMSGIDLADGTQIRKGASAAVFAWLGIDTHPEAGRIVEEISQQGGTPLVVALTRPAEPTGRILGVIHLKDVVKEGLPARFEELRAMGIRTIMVTGDNPLTAAAIAAEAGVDDFLAEAKPEDKLELIRREQSGGHLVAMTGDGTNDAPALAQANVGVAMNSGTAAAKEAGNMVDLDSDPAKLIDIVQIGKQLLITRGALTTFSIANDLAKYFAVIPALFMGVIPGLAVLNVLDLHSPATAILSAVIFNAVIIVALVPLALRGVKYRPLGPSKLLAHNLRVFGITGVIAPFVGIKLIDMLLSLIPGI